MKRFCFLLFIAFMVLAAGCAGTGEMEKYLTTNKGLVFVYGKNFAFSSFKPAGWLSDRLVTMSTKLSVYLRPTNREDICIFAYGIVLTNRGTNQSALAEDIALSLYRDESPKYPGLKWELIPSPGAADKSLQNIRYRFDGVKKGKGFYQESEFVVWEKAMVVIAMRTENPALIAEGRKLLDRFVSGVRYWGTDGETLSQKAAYLILRKNPFSRTNSVK